MVIFEALRMKEKKTNNDSTEQNKRKHVTIETASVAESESSVEEASDDEEKQSDAGDIINEDGITSTDSGSNDGSSESKEDSLMKNEGWADSIAKILGTNKPKNKKTLVLSRAKKYSEVIKKEEPASFDVVGDDKPNVLKIKTEAETLAKKRKIDHPTARVKPNILEKDRERVLAKIATKGVVQLFNAVKNQQNTFGREIKDAGHSEVKKDKILKKFDKRTFLDTLMGQTKSTIVEDTTMGLKDETKEEDKPRWGALRDDFMMGAKMKDWDKTLDD